MDRRITLERSDENIETSGDVTETPVRVATVWAEVTPLTGRESFASAQVYAEVDTRFRIRWRAGVTPEMMVNYEDRRYDIVAALEVGRRDGLDILATARAE